MQTFPKYNQISHYHNRVKHTTGSKVVYLVLLLFFVLSIVSLFFIIVDVNIKSRGIVTTLDRQGEVYNFAYGLLDSVFVKENIGFVLPQENYGLPQSEPHAPTK